MSKIYTDEERMKIAKKQYENLDLEGKVTINNGSDTVGYVSQVNNKPTGEQSFVITDKYVSPTASLGERNQVQEITVLYRGSTAPSIDNLFNPSHKDYDDVRKDWVHNDLPTAFQVLNGGAPVVTPQLQSSVDTLREVMKLYPNAQVNVYGHSLGSMNAQYAIANLDKKDIGRINGGFFYQGPNVHSLLSLEQQDTINALNSLDRLFNYVDAKDLVPIGYGVGKSTIGHLIKVDGKKVGVVDQHMWGGYQFDEDGNLLTDKEGSLQLAKYTTNQQLSAINNLRKNFMKSGGGLSSSEAEILTALSNGGATEAKIVTETVQECEESLAEATKIEQEYDQLLQQINEAIKNQVETDQELAQQIGSLYG
ncbi:hypothetical protein [uncultured Enterococcus sp.]|uniref:hypothetical protein n=1 Tax=uncultured Enterococcus sp. TaxID=167972 RepID=UPI002AA61D58|nr:hypothetical protein [uncultured Enterococcus sp.]